MAQKEKKTKASRAHKESKGKHGGGGKVKLTPIQKILLVNGGQAHHLRSGKSLLSKPIKKRKVDALD